MTRSHTLLGPLMAAAALLLCGFAADGSWLSRVPASARSRQNPYANDPEAAAAGARLYAQHCAACHGASAEGRSNKPGLHTERVHNATDGELAWLLENGNVRKGMPSWSKLPDQQRWQLVSYLKSLDVHTGSESKQP